MKKTISILMVSVLLILSSTVGVFAVDNPQEPQISGVLDINNTQTVTGEAITFDELVKEIAKDNNITKKQALDQIIENRTKTKAKGMTINNSKSREDILMELRADKYRKYYQTLDVARYYKPQLKFYCKVSEYEHYRGIKEILNVTMIRSYNSTSRQFGGSVYVYLENPAKIYWDVNGDFYHNGTTSVQGGGSVGISVGASATVDFNASYATNHYLYYEEDGYYKL